MISGYSKEALIAYPFVRVLIGNAISKDLSTGSTLQLATQRMKLQ